MKKIFYLVLFVISYTGTIKAQLWNGYTLVAASNGTTATLYDTSWAVYHTWTGLGSNTGYSSYLMPGGYLWRAAKGGTNPSGVPGGPICGRITKHDYAGNLLWNYIYNATNYVSHHDIQPLPNGNVLVIAYERRTSAEVAAAGSTYTAGEMWPDKIVEIQQTGATTGTVVWEWKSWDHLMQNVDPVKPNYVTSLEDNPQLLNINYKPAKDWQHMNGIDYNPKLDQIAWSSHNHYEWYIIDHSTSTAEAAGHTGGNSGKGGDILYRWGNPAAYGAGTTANQILNVTHDSHWADDFSPVAGRLCGFNNKGISASQSCADQIITPVNGYNYTIPPGSAFLPASYTSRNTATTLYTSNMGSTQQLPNGNEFVCEATSGTVMEFNSAGALLNTKVFSGAMAQSRKYGACYITNQPPAMPTITVNNNDLSTQSYAAYQWYLNGQPISGATSQNFTTIQSGVYVVRVTDNNGCVYQHSTGYKHNLVPTVMAELNFGEKVTVYPNPTTGLVKLLGTNTFGKEFKIQVCDNLGRILQSHKNTEQIDLSSFSNGVYYLKLTSQEGVATKSVILNK